MSAEFTGVQVQELESTTRYDPRTGWTTIRHWKGEPSQIALYETSAATSGYRFSTSWDGGYKVISVDYPESESNDPSVPLSENWEADTNYIQKDIWSLPTVQTELAKIGGTESPQVRGFFRNDLESLARGNPITLGEDGEETTVTLAILLDVASLYGADWTVFLALFNDLTKGVTSYEIEQYVVRQTKVTNNSSSIVAARENLGRMHTAAFMESQLPEDVKFEVPEDGYWLKRKPSVSRIEKGKWEIVQEWWHTDAYSTLIYPGEPINA
jgi:hypothetical protein